MYSKSIFIALFLLLINASFSQTTKIKIQKQNSPAYFPGGDDSLTRYLKWRMGDKNNLSECDVPECSGFIYLDKNGHVTKFELLTGKDCKACAQDFTKVIKAMPNWMPATDELGNNTKDRYAITYKIKKGP